MNPAGPVQMEVHEAYTITAAVEAARSLGLFDILGRQPSTAHQLARACDMDPRGTEALLRVLAHVGVLEEQADGRYRPMAASDDPALEMWQSLEARLRQSPAVVACDTAAGAASVYPRGVTCLAAMLGEAAAHLAPLLVAPGLRVLDVGAGAAQWSLALRRLDPSIHVTALDLPEVVATTRRVVAEAGAGDGFAYIEGDIFAVDLPGSAFDLAVVGMLCHLFGADRNRDLMRSLYRALVPGGTIAIVDVVPDPVGQCPPDRLIAAYDLSLFLRTGEGRAHPFSALAGWLNEAGFAQVERIPLPGAVAPTLVRARKPG